jgi:hypothetical protein
MYPVKPAASKYSKFLLWLIIFSIGVALSTNSFPAFSAPVILTKTTPAPNTVIQSIRQAIKKQFGIAEITVVEVTEQNWPDGCLGLPKNQELCTQVVVPGWRIEVTDNLQTWFYRSDKTGKVLRLEEPERTILPQATAKKLIKQIATETKIPAAKLRISAVKAKTYGGCLGIYLPRQACTKIAIRGWQAIVTSPSQTYVYHLTQNAERVIQNKTASGAKSKIRVSYETFGEISTPDPNEVFRSSSSGDFTGRMSSTVLTPDGKITRYQSSPTARFAPVVIKTLSSRQLNAFKTKLENLQFPNFNGLTYLTSAAVADYPTTTYQSPSGATQFIDLGKQHLPAALQQMIATWEALIATTDR